MSRFPLALLFVAIASLCGAAELPPAAKHAVDFAKEIKPLFEASCIKCHAKGNHKGGFSLETRDRFLEGGDTGVAAELGKSGESLIVELVAGVDPEHVMPKKGMRWTPEEVGKLRAWIDQGATWPAEITFVRPPPRNLQPRVVALPEGEGNPVDRLLARYFAEHQVAVPGVVDDRAFVRRAYLDTIGLLPTPEQLGAFLHDRSANKRAELVHTLLANRRSYTEHWLSFWNDLLRNDYKGTGFIDGGRKQISEWLYNSLMANKPYDRFVAELMNPAPVSEGFTAGILWRGNVASAMSQPMQAAQSTSQVFLGINLKCASCHDSFVSDWLLADAYGMAAIFSEKPLELVRCDKPQGQKAALRFLYPELGAVAADGTKSQRREQLAALMTQPQNGRLSKTLINRLWARLFGRGLVEPVDDMEKPAWSADLLDWLASDLEQNGYDVKHTLEVLMTSRAYAAPAVESAEGKEFVFRGPLVRRLSAEQFSDAVSQLTGEWAPLPSTLEFDLTGGGLDGNFTLPQWLWTDEPLSAAGRRIAARYAKAAAENAVDMQMKAEHGEAKPSEAQEAVERSVAMQAWADTYDAEVRHRVVFRKSITLAAAPRRAWATVLGTQSFDVMVNGRVVKSKMANGALNGRVRLYDFAPHLKPGENTIAISMDSHTEKALTDPERKTYWASMQHLNRAPGFAFYANFRFTGAPNLEVVSDATWRVRRSPDGSWADSKADIDDWSFAQVLPANAAPVDEGPGLEPIRRQDFANIPVPLGPALRPASSTAALSENIRASMIAADTLQTALDRPNREIVTSGRQNAATTLQALELTNGAILATRLETAGARIDKDVERLYLAALGRSPTESQATVAREMLGTSSGATDLLWALVMLPEFQLIR